MRALLLTIGVGLAGLMLVGCHDDHRGYRHHDRVYYYDGYDRDHGGNWYYDRTPSYQFRFNLDHRDRDHHDRRRDFDRRDRDDHNRFRYLNRRDRDDHKDRDRKRSKSHRRHHDDD